MIRQAFPSQVPIGLMLGGVFAALALVPTFAIFRTQLDPVRGHYLKTYLKLSTMAKTKGGKPQSYRLLTVNSNNSAVLPTCQMTTRFLLPTTFVTLSADYLDAAGNCDLVTSASKMKVWLRDAVYQGQSFTEVLKTPLMIWGVLALVLVVAGGIADSQRKTKARLGVQIRGPELMSRSEFNSRVHGDGFPIVFENKRNLKELWDGHNGKVLRIRRRDESKNIICMSDPGGGKTSILMQILDEVERRG